MKTKLDVEPADLVTLRTWLRAHTIPAGLALRARVIVASAEGEGPRPLARRLGISPSTACHWRRRYAREGLAGLAGKPKPGRPRRISEAQERAIVAAARSDPDGGAGLAAGLAAQAGVSVASVRRLWRRHGVGPAMAAEIDALGDRASRDGGETAT